MAIDVGAILARAYQTVIKHRVLWVLGLLIALLTGTGNNNINFRVDSGTHIQLFQVDFTPGPALIGLLVAGALLVAVAFFVVRAALDASLIAAGDSAARDTPLSLREAWRAGRKGMWAVLGLNLISLAFAILLAAVIVLMVVTIVGTGVISALLAGRVDVPEPARVLVAVGWGIMGVLLVLLVAVPAAVLLAVVTQVAQRAAVLDGQTLGVAWKTGWRLARSNGVNIVALILVQFVVGLLVGALVAFLLIPLIGVPALAIVASGSGVSAGLVALMLLAILCAWLVNGAVQALPTAWNSLLWTLFYRAATVGLPERPVPIPPYGGRLPPVPGNAAR